MKSLSQDLKFSFRQMNRNKLFSMVFVLLLAISIRAETVIFGFVDALLLRPLPVRNPHNLFLLQKIRQLQPRPDVEFHYRQYQGLLNRQDLFASIAEQSQDLRAVIALTSGDKPELVTTQIVSPNYFSELGIRPFIGRLLTPADAGPPPASPPLLAIGSGSATSTAPGK